MTDGYAAGPAQAPARPQRSLCTEDPGRRSAVMRLSGSCQPLRAWLGIHPPTMRRTTGERQAMNKLMLAGAAVLMMSLPAAGFAKGNGSLENVPYAVKAKCETLMQRFDDASANPKDGVNLAAAK